MYKIIIATGILIYAVSSLAVTSEFMGSCSQTRNTLTSAPSRADYINWPVIDCIGNPSTNYTPICAPGYFAHQFSKDQIMRVQGNELRIDRYIITWTCKINS